MPKELCWHTSFFFYSKVSDSDLLLPLHFFFLYLNILGLKCIVNLLYNERKGSVTRSAHLRSKWEEFFPLLKYVFSKCYLVYVGLCIFTCFYYQLMVFNMLLLPEGNDIGPKAVCILFISPLPEPTRFRREYSKIG